jgi:hypothetical protein
MATKKAKAPCVECEKLEKMLRDEEIQHLCDKNKAEVEREELLGVIQALVKKAAEAKKAEETHRQRSVRYLIAIVPMMLVITLMTMLQNGGIVGEDIATTIGWVMIVGITFCAAVIWERIKK